MMLNEVQRADAERLWKSQLREVVEVRTTQELDAARKAGTSVIPRHDFDHLVRLHEFFLAHLHLILGQENSSIGFLKYQENPLQSCLGPYVRLALVSATTVASQSFDFVHENHQQYFQQQQQNSASGGRPSKVVWLWEGRRTVSLHYEEFIAELHYFLVRGNEEQLNSQEWCQKQSFGAFLFHKPKQALATIGTAMSLAMLTLWRATNNNINNGNNHRQSNSVINGQLERFLDASKIQIRLINVSPKMNMMDVKTGVVGKFISVKGHVVKARPKRLRVAVMDFQCKKCRASIVHAFDSGKFSMPTKCTTLNCKSRAFVVAKTMAYYTDVQELKLQEAQDESIHHSGRTPRQMAVELTHDLVDSCRPGDIVLLSCIVDTVNTAVAAGRTGKRAKEACTYTLVLLGHSITTFSETTSQNRNGNKGSTNKSSSTQFSQQQLQGITQLCHADHKYFSMTERMAFPFDLLVRSLCPNIFGHYEVKAGILLCLLGGTPPADTYSRTAASEEIRSNSHILIVGDPGMGKSQMLLAATQLAARSVYVGGNTASTTGLTVTLTKEENGESGIEAGALVLADNGVCCIDEFDKMNKKSQDGLLEAMEQQEVSIAKAGVLASLPSRCSIIAAANPKHGSYNMNKTVSENLNMSKPILSRFDLVYILRDRADQNLDRRVSSSIMNLHRERGTAADGGGPSAAPSARGTAPPMTYTQQNKDPTHLTRGGQDRIPIWERLAWVADFQKNPLPADLVRDYIAYAREFCKPKMTAEAASVLKDYFMQLRYPEGGLRRSDTVPITTRQLEAMIRLSQARAKACLREYVLEGDALDVVELMRKSVDQVHSDENNKLDPLRGGAAGMSNRKMRKLFEAKMKEIIGVGAECGLDDLRCIADQVSFSLTDFKPMIDDLRDKGVLLLKSDGRYQIVS